MNNFGYSSEKNIQILLAVLKTNNVKKIIASPGTTNADFVGSVQSDPWFEVYSSVDERSAAYIACGMAAESGEAVVLSCTGATASRDYYPGMTEAFYRKLPILAVTSHRGQDRIGHLLPQQIDRTQIPHDIARLSVELPRVRDARDEEYVVNEANRAVLELFRDGGGPVHINLIAPAGADFSVRELPEVRTVKRYFAWDNLPDLPNGRIAIFLGSSCIFSDRQKKAIERFCATYDALVICDHSSGYYGKYRLLPTLAHFQEHPSKPIGKLDLMIHIGGVSAATFAGTFETKEIWRVCEDGEPRNPYKKLTRVFQMPEWFFFEQYGRNGENKHAFIDEMKEAYSRLYARIPELPFSNIWSAQQLSSRIPKDAIFQISVSNTRRSWNMFPMPEGVTSGCNVGCCGIDGCTSTLVGASLVSPDKLHFLVTGDLAFFYDLNVLGNRHIGRNVRILLVNNGVGAEFRIYTHYCYKFGEDTEKYIAAGGHNGHRSPQLVKHIAEDLGFQYLSANDKEEYMKAFPVFVNPKMTDKPMIFEIFTTPGDESDALKLMRTLNTDAGAILQSNIKEGIKSALGKEGIKFVKNILGK